MDFTTGGQNFVLVLSPGVIDKAPHSFLATVRVNDKDENAMYQAVTGHLAAGSTLTITSTHPKSGRTITAKVKVLTVEPDAELRWVSKLLGRTISERTFQLSSTADGTSLVQAGTYRGLFARFPPKTERSASR